MIKKEKWGQLYERYKDKDQPRKILTIDGGGIRGILALGILKQIENQLRDVSKAGDSFRLCDYFDYIGGTSTGAIIAASLALGKSVSEISTMYEQNGKAMFAKAPFFKRLIRQYDSRNLKKELQLFFGKDTTLLPQYLKCLLLIVTMNVDTDSPWPISSNPEAKYNDISREDCNLKVPLWQLVRASTAAPFYFGHEEIVLNPKKPDQKRAFVDGGVTPHNNPAWLLYRMVTNPAYNLGWKTGEKNLLVVSVGTGEFSRVGRYKNVGEVALNLSPNLLSTMSIEKDVSCRHVGRCSFGAEIDREIGDMIPRDDKKNKIPLEEDLGRAFLYARYNADISSEGLKKLGLHKINAANVQKMDSIQFISNLMEIGDAAGQEIDVKSHFGSFV